MGLARFSICKYVRTSKGWRYCKPAHGNNNKLKPNAVLVAGKEEIHPEGNCTALHSVPGAVWTPCAGGGTRSSPPAVTPARVTRHMDH